MDIGGKGANDSFVESLRKLTARDGPLQRALAEVQGTAGRGDSPYGGKVEESLRQMERELETAFAGSRRIARRLEQMQGLVRTSALITSSLEIDRVLAEVMDTAIELTDAERAYLMLREEGTGALEMRAARNWDRESIAEYDASFSRSIIDDVLAKGEPVLTVNAQGDSRFGAFESVLVNDLRSIICIPLKLRDRVTGVLYADNRFEQGVFDDDSVELVAGFANHAAVAIENARHFQRVRADLAQAREEVSRLRIEINEQRLDQELSEVTETEYFQRLAAMASDLRDRRAGGQ